MKKVLAIVVVLVILIFPITVWAQTATLSYTHDCQDSPAPAGSNQTVSGFGGFNIYQSDAITGQYAKSDAITGCNTNPTVNMKFTPTSWFKVTAFDVAGNESIQSSPAISKTVNVPAPILPPPSNIQMNASGTITWTVAPGAISTKIYIHDKSSPTYACGIDMQCVTVVAPAATTNVVVDPAKTYDAWMTSVNKDGIEGGAGGFAVVVPIVLKPDTTAPLPPTNVQVSMLGEDQIMVAALPGKCTSISAVSMGQSAMVTCQH